MPAEPNWVVRFVEQFSNKTEKLVNSIRLPVVELRDLQDLWGLPSSEPMVGCFEIGQKQVEFFERRFGMRFDFTQYSYFVSAATTDWEATKLAGGYMGLYPPPVELG